MSGSHLSRELFDLVKAIGECRSKQEEDKIIDSETSVLKQRFQDVSNLQNPKKVRDLLIRSIYVEMLGHDASTFAYIHGVNLCHNKSLVAKRVGYLVSCLFLDPERSELMILLINTIQKDLRSSNLLEISFALIVVSRLANAEMVPVLSSLVTPLLNHSSEMIRRRAVVAFHRLFQISGDSNGKETHQVVRKSLGDSDPGVMAVGLNMLQDIVKHDPTSCLDLIPSVVAILKQVIDHRLPKDFEYHRMPAPWVQLRLVSILGLMGKGVENSEITAIVQETMRRADIGSNAGAAVAFECVKTAAKLAPNHTLLEHASLVVSRFLASESHNYKYLGVTGLSLLVAVNPAFANEHQMLVVDCLEDSDDTLRRRTIDLLTQMTNGMNVTVVVEKMLLQLDYDPLLAQRICTLCERFAPSNEWYLKTLNEVLRRVGDAVVENSVVENLSRLVAEQDGPDAEGIDLRIVAANEYVGFLEQVVGGDKKVSSQFLNLVVWMVGEFASMTSLDGYKVDDVVDLLIESVSSANDQTIPLILTAVAKLAVVSGSSVTQSSAVSLFEKMPKHPERVSVEIERRCRDYLFLLSQPSNVQMLILPLDASCEYISVDLRFVDKFCAEARSRGAREYKRPVKRATVVEPTVQGGALKGLKFDPYELPKISSTLPPVASGLQTPVTVGSPPPVMVSQPASVVPVGGPKLLAAGGAKRWGPTVAAKPAPVTEQLKLQPEKVVTPEVAKAVQPPPQPTLSKEYLEKQRMAAALFCGVSAKASAPSSVQSVKKPQPTSAPASNLLNFDAGEAPSNVATKPTESRSVSDDLLDL